MLEARRPPRRLRRDRGAAGHLARRRRGRDRHADRRQRRRQDDDADGHLRLLQPARAAAITFDGQDIAARAGSRDRSRSASPSRRRAARSFRGSPCSRTWRWARSPAATPTGSRKDIERVFELFPILGERRDASRRHAVGRRAADAGRRPRADGAPEAAAARRAVARAWRR